MHGELVLVTTSPTCRRYQLVARGRVVWQNRVAPTPAGDAGARARLATWAAKHGYTVEQPRKRA